MQRLLILMFVVFACAASVMRPASVNASVYLGTVRFAENETVHTDAWAVNLDSFVDVYPDYAQIVLTQLNSVAEIQNSYALFHAVGSPEIGDVVWQQLFGQTVTLNFYSQSSSDFNLVLQQALVSGFATSFDEGYEVDASAAFPEVFVHLATEGTPMSHLTSGPLEILVSSDSQLHSFQTGPSNSVLEPSTLALIAMALLSLFGFGMVRRRADGERHVVEDNFTRTGMKAFFRSLIFSAGILFGLLDGAASRASTIVSYGDGSSSLDKITGLRWLDMTESVNRSYNDVSANFGSGGDFEGYRYATANEVLTLWKHAGTTGGGTPISCVGPDCLYSEIVAAGPVNDLVALLGGTTWAASYGFDGVIGLSSTPSIACVGCGYTAYMTPEFRVFYQHNNPQLFGLAEALIVEGLRDNIANPSYASWLVSSTALAPVPEPSTIALIAMALLSLFGFGVMRRRAAHPTQIRRAA